MNNSPLVSKVELTISVITIVKIAAAGFAIYAFVHLWPLFLLLLLSVLLAVSLHPWLQRLEQYLPRRLALAILILLIGVTVLALGYFIVPPLIEQLSRIVQRLPNAVSKILLHLPESNPLRHIGLKALQQKQFEAIDLETWASRILTAGQVAVGGLTSLGLIYVFTIYLLIDGQRTFQWITSFFQHDVQTRLNQTARQIVPVISAYVRGQLVTSLLCGFFVSGLLKYMEVPAALTLGILAGFFDILPIVGFVMAMVPTVLFALTVSPWTALIVFLAFSAYHVFENYVLVPWVYGSQLRLSGFAILLSLLLGSIAGGVAGAILVLPLAASFSIIELIWLGEILGSDVIARHNKLIKN